MIMCPVCNQDKLYYVNDVTESYEIVSVEKDNIELGPLADTYVNEKYSFWCHNCNSEVAKEDVEASFIK